MPLISGSNLNYSDRDFDSLRTRLQGLVRYVFPDWTDFNVASFGNMLLELFCYVGDTLHFYQDNQANEAFWPTLTQRASAIKLGRLIGFSLRGATSSVGSVTFSLPFAAPTKVIIPEGTKLLTSDPENPLKFRTTAYAEIIAGNTSVTVAVEQAEVVATEYFESTDEPNQELILARTPYLDNSAIITAANGVYTEASSLLGATATSLVYTVIVDERDRAYIRFGNGVSGAIPMGQIAVDYKVGGGFAGDVEAARITFIEDIILYEGGGTAPVTVTNASRTSGGVDRMSLAEARLLAPTSITLGNNTIGSSDFENRATATAGIARALFATANEYYGIPENTGILYVVSQGAKLSSGCIAPAASTSTELLSAITSDIMTNKPPAVTFTFTTVTAEFLSVTVTTRVYLERGAVALTVGNAIRAALADFFSVQLADGSRNTKIDFGAKLKNASGTIVGELAWSDIFNVIRDINGVRRVDEGIAGLLLNGRRASITLSPIQFPKLSTVSIVNADTGNTI